PTAQITAPVYLGEDCSVGPDVRLGPGTAVGANCVLEDGCMATHSVILPDTYVGRGLELEDAVAAGNRLVNARLGGAVTVTDPFLLAPLSGPGLRSGLGGLFARLTALLLLVLAAPVLLATMLCLRLFRRGP